MLTIFNRIYSDYLMKNRYELYRKIIETALTRGYEHMSLIKFYELVQSGRLEKGKKIFIHRHDIDTDVKGAELYFNIERSFGVITSYYFRLSTLDIKLMKRIQEYGSEASYHFEEIATYCKQHKIKSSAGVEQSIESIREQFKNNFRNTEHLLGYKMQTVASHGDFVNRKLKVSNNFLMSGDIKRELGIVAEAYEPVFLDNYSVAISDKPAPLYFAPMHPLEALEKDLPVIYLLTHPRQWRTHVLINTKDNLQRFTEGIMYEYF